MILQLTQLLTNEHRPGGRKIKTLPVVINLDKVVGFEPYEYQHIYADESSTKTGSRIIWDISSHDRSPLHVRETLNEILRQIPSNFPNANIIREFNG